MKIVHLCLGCFFPDHYSYQENMLPKFHKELGYDTEVIASLVTFDRDGKETLLPSAGRYLNEYGIPVTRLEYRKPRKVYRKLKRYIGTRQALEQAAPDILFIHGCQFRDLDIVIGYVKAHPGIRVFVDNHADFSNSGTNFLSLHLLHRFLWRRGARRIEPYTEKFYGVLPARVDWLTEQYRLPKDKCELLVMGADDDRIREAEEGGWREKIRERYGIRPGDFLVMTGGKIDGAKKQTLLLMEAVRNLGDPRVKLIVFGSVVPEMKEQVNALADGEKVQYIGWVKSEESYRYWIAADLAVFPGRHSVFWEQVAGMGIPMICKYWEGTTHVDRGGNAVFLRKDSEEEIRSALEEVTRDPEAWERMKKAAGAAREVFSYREIAKRAVQEKE